MTKEELINQMRGELAKAETNTEMDVIAAKYRYIARELKAFEKGLENNDHTAEPKLHNRNTSTNG